MILKSAVITAAWLILLPGAALSRAGAEKTLASPQLIRATAAEISGEIAFRYTVRISGFDRIQANQGWHDAAVWIKGELENMGFTDAVVEGWTLIKHSGSGHVKSMCWRHPTRTQPAGSSKRHAPF